MRDYSEAHIKITEITFRKEGSITFVGTIDGHERVLTWTSDCADFDKILPHEPAEYEYLDDDGLFTGWMDDYFNIHFLIKIGGNIVSRVVRLEKIAGTALFELYQNTLQS